MREYRQAFVNGLRVHQEIPSQNYLESRKYRKQIQSMTRTNGMNIISEPWIFNEHGEKNQMTNKSPSLKARTSSINPNHYNNPDEVEISSPNAACYRTGMQGIFSDLVNDKATNGSSANKEKFYSTLGRFATQ